MDRQNDYRERTDEEVHGIFTKYVRKAIEGARITYIQKKYHNRAISLEGLLESAPDTLAFDDPSLELVLDNMESLEQIICNDSLLVAILRLNDRERRIMSLRLVHKMKHREIADLLGVTPHTVEKSYSRSIMKLREYLEEGKSEKL